MQPLLPPPVHALGNGILMAAGEGGKNQRPGVRTALINVHSGAALVYFHNGRQIVKIQPGVNTVGIQIHGQCHHIHVARPLAVAEEGSLYPVGSCQKAQFRIRHAGAPVIVGVQGDGDVFPVFQIFTHILHLTGVHMGQAHLHRYRKVDDNIVGFTGHQHIQYSVADLQRIFRLRTREALR